MVQVVVELTEHLYPLFLGNQRPLIDELITTVTPVNKCIDATTGRVLSAAIGIRNCIATAFIETVAVGIGREIVSPRAGG